MPTLQETYETVATHLLTQNKKAEVFGKCRYLTADPDGNTLKCAVGVLIPTPEYTPDFENSSVYDMPGASLISDYMSSKGYNLGFLIELQRIHDRYDTDEWKSRLYSLGNEFGLDTSFLDNIPV